MINITSDKTKAFDHIVTVPSTKFSGFQSANIIIGRPDSRDIESLFDPGEEPIIEIPEDFRWPQLLKHLGIFSSTGQARKNGWDKDIPEGWSEVIFKKKRKVIFVLKEVQDAACNE